MPRQHLLQHLLLLTTPNKIFGRKPGPGPQADFGPVLGNDREPAGVARAAFDDHMAAEMALVGIAKAQGRASRGGIQRIAFPVQPAIAPVIKTGLQAQKMRLSCQLQKIAFFQLAKANLLSVPKRSKKIW